jgi:uncharacterized SAM-binding protein YcdF (DUF218 family)
MKRGKGGKGGKGRAVAVVLVLLAAGAVALLPGAGEWLAVDDPLPASADLGCVLNGESPARVMEAARLYRAGAFPLVFLPRGPVPQALLAGKRLGLPIAEEQEVNQAALLKLGVPANAVILGRSPAVNTADEAQQTAAVIAARGLSSLVVVTSPFHTRRAGIIFRRVLPEGVAVHVAGSPYSESRPDRWWGTHRDRRDVFLEFQKLLLGSLPAGGGR